MRRHLWQTGAVHQPWLSRNISLVPQRVDFSPNSNIYDHRHGAVISDQLAQTLTNRVRRGATIIDIGAGTGRVAIALAGKGFQVIAVDPAVPMLQVMQRKSGEEVVLAVSAEGTRLPFRRKSADAIVLARLLYLVEDWQGLLREGKEILRQGGILFHEWGNGDPDEAWVQVREKARSLLEDAGVETPFHPGARSEVQVDSFLRDLGFHRKEQIEAGTGPTITLADFLNRIQSGEFSYVWNVPQNIQDSCLPQLKRWCESKFDLYQPAPMPAELRWVLYENAT